MPLQTQPQKNKTYQELLIQELLKQVDNSRVLVLLRRCSFLLDSNIGSDPAQWKQQALDEVGPLLRKTITEKLCQQPSASTQEKP